MSLINFFLFFVISLNAFSMSLEDEKKYDELEGAAFFKALITDKKFAEVVKQFGTVRKNDSELGEIYFYLADAYYNLKKFDKAQDALAKGEKYRLPDGYYSLWGNVSFSLKSYGECRTKFKKISLKQMASSDWKIYFQCLEKSNHTEEAVEMALNFLSEDEEFFLEAQRVLTRFELHEAATQKRQTYLNTCRTSDFYLRLWDSNSDSQILESGHACYPERAEITSVLVKHLFQEGKYHSIAWLFETMSVEDRMYFKHTAEFYRVAGRYVVADYFFSLGEEKDFLLARSSYFLGQENYAALLTLPIRPEQTRLNKDLAYALAFSHFKYLLLGDSVKLLAGQNSTNQKQLLNLVEQCQKMDWRCRP